MQAVSQKAAHLTGSEIIRLAADIQEKIRQGKKIFNFTVGDFDPSLFPIPQGLRDRIIKALTEGHTNYPPADGMASLKTAVLNLLRDELGMEYLSDEVLIASGGRPLIYAIYQSVVDPGEGVIYPVPSWNNNHYAYLTQARKIEVEARPENAFMPVADELRPYIQDAVLLSLCSPLNPTGTVFSQSQLQDICTMVLEENRRREGKQKPLYILYDQIYWMLTMPGTRHIHPVMLEPALKPYTLYVDGISKGFAATGVRVGWSVGPANVIGKMKSIIGHVGAWAPKAEQQAVAEFLAAREEVNEYLSFIRSELHQRLEAFYKGFKSLSDQGFSVEAIDPAAAIYLTVGIHIKGKTRPDGKKIENIDDATAYLLEEASLAMVPFYAFGKNRETYWYRLSVGTARKEEIPYMFEKLKFALEKLI